MGYFWKRCVSKQESYKKNIFSLIYGLELQVNWEAVPVTETGKIINSTKLKVIRLESYLIGLNSTFMTVSHEEHF